MKATPENLRSSSCSKQAIGYSAYQNIVLILDLWCLGNRTDSSVGGQETAGRSHCDTRVSAEVTPHGPSPCWYCSLHY